MQVTVNPFENAFAQKPVSSGAGSHLSTLVSWLVRARSKGKEQAEQKTPINRVQQREYLADIW